jgi:hypothetical protein
MKNHKTFCHSCCSIKVKQRVMGTDKKTSKEETSKKQAGDAKGKVSFDQNGDGAAPKYGQAGTDPSKTKEGAKKGKL